jgi:hypothetical protein
MIERVFPGMALIMLSAVGFAAAPAAVSPSGHQVGEEAVVLETMDRYMVAISANDLEAMASMQTPDGMTYRARSLANGTAEIVGRPNSYWVDPARKDNRTFRERYWSPTVLIRGSIAVVWAPYEFQIDSKTSHCGVDVFSFIKVGDEWRVANSMWTVEPDACAELRPENAKDVRPSG